MHTKLHRRLIWSAGILSSLIILSGFLIVLLPTITKWYAGNWLEKQGVTSNIGDVEIKLLDGQFNIKSLEITGPEKHKVRLGELNVQIHLRDLFEHKITIEKVQLSNLYVDIYQQMGRPIKVGGILIGDKSDEQSGKNSEKKNTQPWEIVLRDIDFKDLETCVQTHNQDGKLMYNDCLALGDFTWEGKTSYLIDAGAKNPSANLGVNLSFALKNLKLHDNSDNSNVVDIGALHVNQLVINGLSDISVESIEIDDYKLLQRDHSDSNKDTYIASINRVSFNQVGIKDLHEYHINDIQIADLRTYLLRNQKGDFEPAVKARQLFLPETLLEAEQKSGKEPVHAENFPIITVNNLSVDGNSVISVKDTGIKPPYIGSITHIKASLENIDTSKPLNRSPLMLDFIIGEVGKVKFDGDIALFARRPTAKLKGTIRAMDAADFSVYLNSTLQHHIKSGQVDADIMLSLEDGKLDSVFDFVFYKLYVEELSKEESQEYQEKLGMPLSTALNLLREKDDSIHLKLPVTGDVKNPDFSLNDVIRKVMADAIKNAVINYYTPFGLVSLAKAAFNLATALRFNPVIFEPTKTDVSDDSRQQLEKLVTLLKERPNIKLVMCGYATLEDRFMLYPVDSELEKKARSSIPGDEDNPVDLNTLLPELTDKQRSSLEELALERGNKIRDYLSNVKDIDPARIIMCKPRFSNDQGQPRVELSL